MIPLFVIVAIVSIVVLIIMMIPTMLPEVLGFVLNLKSNDYDGWVYYARLLMKKGRLEHAHYALQQAIHIRPEDARAWKTLGELYTMTGLQDKADSAFKRAKFHRKQ